MNVRRIGTRTGAVVALLTATSLVACGDDGASTSGGGGGSECAQDYELRAGDLQCGQGEAPVCTYTGTPDGCSGTIPTCGCDGEIYDDPCAAQRASGIAEADAFCTLTETFFGCGPYLCQRYGTGSGEYCEIHDDIQVGTQYSCNALANECEEDATCSCVTTNGLFAGPTVTGCEDDAAGGIRVSTE